MKSNHLVSILLVVTIMLLLSSCTLPVGGAQPGTADISGTVAARVAIEQAAQTMVAQTLSAALPVLPTNTNTLEQPIATETPKLTPTITISPTVTLTPTLEGVSLVVSQDTYCRSGAPYAVFKSIVIIKTGQQVEVIARNPENDSFYVRNPYANNSTCWIYGKYATINGNSAALIVATLQPTPTPTFTPTPNSNFLVNYSGLETCQGQYGLKFYVKNSGGSIWQSIVISGSDTVTNFGIIHTSNFFNTYSGCTITMNQADLTAGEDSFVLSVAPGQMDYDPTGHLFNVTIKLCSQDNAGGNCISKVLTFTP